MRLSLDVIIHAVGGTLSATSHVDDTELILSSVCSDSREAKSDSLFVCLPGEHVDGHDFAAQAVLNGAAAILAVRDPLESADGHHVPVILVDDTVVALGRLAHFWRKQCASSVRVVGITGTAGKTTVKEVLAQVLQKQGLTAKNPLNLNNQIGLPLSMLATSGEEAFWVMEAGISHPRDMDELGAILEPDLAVILNVGPGHAAGLGDRGTAHYKSRLLAYLAPEGAALISADYPDLVRESRSVRQMLTFFSTTGRQVEYRAAYVVPAGEGKGLYRLWLNGECVDVEAPFRGAFGAENVIAVAAVAHQLGVPAADVAAGLAEAVLPKQRFACSRHGKWLVIDDSYNANPLSFSRMLEAAAEMAGERNEPFVCVLGEMGELGSLAESEHEKLGKLIARSKARLVLWKGGYADAILTGLKSERFNGTFAKVATVADMEKSLESAGHTAQSGGVILFKGSRANKLEELVHAFTAARIGN